MNAVANAVAAIEDWWRYDRPLLWRWLRHGEPPPSPIIAVAPASPDGSSNYEPDEPCGACEATPSAMVDMRVDGLGFVHYWCAEHIVGFAQSAEDLRWEEWQRAYRLARALESIVADASTSIWKGGKPSHCRWCGQHVYGEGAGQAHKPPCPVVTAESVLPAWPAPVAAADGEAVSA